MGFLDPAFLLLLYAIPLYIANATPILFHGRTPLDLGIKVGKKPLLGKGKTILGTVSGIAAGTLAGVLIAIFFPLSVMLIPNYAWLGFALSLGAIAGDAAKSFFKRRFNIKRGEKWVVADQLDFIAGGLVLSAILARLPEWWLVILLFAATFFIHSGTNFVAYRLRLKKVPW